MTNRNDVATLIAPYALDAVDGDERRAVEALLAEDAAARVELAGHQEVAAALAILAMEPQGQPGRDTARRVWQSIEQRLDAGLPPQALSIDRPATPRPLGRRHADVRRAPLRRSITSTLMAAASVAVIGVLGTVAIQQSSTIDRLERRMEAAAVAPAGATPSGATPSATPTGLREVALQQALAEPATRVVRLVDEAGATLASIALTEEGAGYLFGSSLPALPDGSTYQLWGVSEGTVLSLGVLGREPTLAPFSAAGAYDRLVLTVERGPGVVSSTQSATAVAEVI